MLRVRTAFLDLSPMLTEILQAHLAPISEVELLDPDARNVTADFLIANAGSLSHDEVVELLYQRPRVKVLTVEEYGPQAFLFELRPERVDLGELSPSRLVSLVRETAAAA